MTMKLIDAEETKTRVMEQASRGVIDSKTALEMIELIDNMPEAYSVDNVMAQLEEYRQKENDIHSYGTTFAYERAQRIVSAGGEKCH